MTIKGLGLMQDKGDNFLVSKKLHLMDLLAFEEVWFGYRVILGKVCQLVNYISKCRACNMIVWRSSCIIMSKQHTYSDLVWA